MKFELEHELPREPERAWALLMGEDYERVSGERSQIRRTLIDAEERDGKTIRRHRMTSERELPAPIAKVVGAKSLSYELIETSDTRLLSLDWKVIPSKLADRVVAEGTYRLVSGKTPDTCVRLVSGEVTVSVALIGKKIETLIGNEIKASYEKSTAFAREYLLAH